MKSKQIYTKVTLLRVDNELHQLLKIEAAKQLMTIKKLVGRYITEGLDKDKCT